MFLKGSKLMRICFTYSAVGVLLLGLAIIVATASAAPVTLNSPVLPGDVFGQHHTGYYLYQVRGGSVISKVPDPVPTTIGPGFWGVASDRAGNLWFTRGDGTVDYPFAIEKIAFGTTTSTVEVSEPDLNVPTGATAIRDVVLDSGGNLYAMFEGGSNTVMRYAPDGSGGFLPGVAVGNFASSFGDRGAGRLAFSEDQRFLVSGNWSTSRLHTMDVTNGSVQSAVPGANVSGGANIGALGLDAVVFSQQYGLSYTAFDPSTGATGASSTQLTTPNYFFDGATHVPEAGRTYFTYRLSGGTVRYATDAQLAGAAASGVPIDLATLPLVFQGADANTTRDLAVTTPSPLQSPVGWGDLFLVDYSLRAVHQYRGPDRVGTLDFGANSLVGGVYADYRGNIYIAGNGIGVYRVGSGETEGHWLVTPDQLASGLTVRDVAAASDGSLYVSYLGGNGRVEKFTPTADGYAISTLGQFGITNGDFGNLHTWLTGNGKYLLTSARGPGMIVAMSIADGSTTTWTADGFNLAAEIALDPFTSDYLVFGTDTPGGEHRLRGLSFDPETGTFGTEVDLLSSSQHWPDAMAFDPRTGDLYMSVRNSQLRMATYQQLLDARGGNFLNIGELPLLVNSSLVQIARDMAITNIPEPSAIVLLVLALLPLGLARRRRAR